VVAATGAALAAGAVRSRRLRQPVGTPGPPSTGQSRILQSEGSISEPEFWTRLLGPIARLQDKTDSGRISEIAQPWSLALHLCLSSRRRSVKAGSSTAPARN
jgi:hypothetical protein